MERLEVLQQRLEHWCAASVRALAGEATAEYRGHVFHVHGEPYPIQSPYLHLDLDTHQPGQLRGVADSLALRLRHSDFELHQQLAPTDPLERLIFDVLEQLRAESLTPNSLPGMRTNLRNRFLYWAKLAAVSRLTGNSIGLLIYSITVICWSRLLNEPIPDLVEVEIEATRMGLADQIGNELFAIKKAANDQTDFAQYALGIARTIHAMAGTVSSADNDDEELENTLNTLIKARQLNMQWLNTDGASWQQKHGIAELDQITALHQHYQYRVFSRAYDVQVEARKVIRAEQLGRLRKQLDKRISQQRINCQRVARHLQQLLSSPQLAGWSFGEEQGYLDSARLARLITSPDEHRLFRQEDTKPKSDCIVSIVVDNSGSMTHNSETIAALVDTLARTLELAGITSEVLGFTTGEWAGGQVHKDWVAAGKPEHPGRLNSIRHTIYKAAGTPWRRARPAIAGMLRSDLFREGVDGEALQWAAGRLQQRTEKNKIILMLSDGSPMDTATHAANPERYLDHHLAQVAQQIENSHDIRVCAIGVGLDLSAYYSNNLPISLGNELTTWDFLAIAELLSEC